MKKIIHSDFSPLFLTGLALVIICAWFSLGSYYPDEHFQILEFCNYKLGYTSANSYALPWEFYDNIRASLLPDIAFMIAKILDWTGLYNPFILAFLLRLFTGVSSWFIVCRFCLLFLQKFKSVKGGSLLIQMSLFLWFIPFLSVRFTPENISGIFLLYGIYSILSITEKANNHFLKYFIAGFWFGISLFIREQIIFALLGFVAWLIIINKSRLKYILMLLPSILIAIGVNIFVDRWFYGGWTFTPYNYYYKNIVQHVAADFNTEPWWFYFTEFSSNVIPPLSWLLMIMFFVGIYKNLKNPFVWIIIPFFLVHCLIGHKEFRFLFPVTFIFIYITVLGFDYLLYKQPQLKGKKLPANNNPLKSFYQKIHPYVYLVLLVLVIPLLIYRTIAPVQFSLYYDKFLYHNAPAKNTPLFYIPNRNVDVYYGVNTSFYKNPDFNTVLVDSFPQIGDYLRNNKPRSALFFTTLTIGTSSQANNNEDINWNGYKISRIYSLFPSWLLNNDINKWKEMTPLYKIYKFTPLDTVNGYDANKLLHDSNSFRSLDAVNDLLSSAHSLLENGKLDEAEKILTTMEDKTRFIAIPHLHNYLGMLYYKKNRMSDAEKEFDTEIAMNLQKEEAYLNLGLLYFQSKDYDNALKAMNNVLKINLNNVDAVNNSGVYYLYVKKDYPNAIQYFSNVLNLNLDYQQGYINFMVCAQHFNNEQVSFKYQRLLLDNRNNPYTWVMVHKGMSASDARANGIDISDDLMKKINALP